MAYQEMLLIPMREDLTKYGVEETRTPAAVDEALKGDGAVLMVINSVCGCAAGKARPAIGEALMHSKRPAKAVTVFAGGDDAAVQHLRQTHLAAFPPSSPSIAIFKGGKPVYFMPRRDIESSIAPQIAQKLKAAFDEHC